MANQHAVYRQRRVSDALSAINNAARQPAPVLPSEGLVDWRTIQHFVPWSQRSMRRMVQDGRFPPGQVVGGYTCWRVEVFRAWLDKTLPALVADA